MSTLRIFLREQLSEYRITRVIKSASRLIIHLASLLLVSPSPVIIASILMPRQKQGFKISVLLSRVITLLCLRLLVGKAIRFNTIHATGLSKCHKRRQFSHQLFILRIPEFTAGVDLGERIINDVNFRQPRPLSLARTHNSMHKLRPQATEDQQYVIYAKCRSALLIPIVSHYKPPEESHRTCLHIPEVRRSSI